MNSEQPALDRESIESARSHEELLEVLEKNGVDISEGLTGEVYEDFIWEASPEGIDMDTLEENPERIFEKTDFFKWRVRDVTRDQWRQTVEENFEPEIDELPGYDIELDDTIFHIRGMCHGLENAGPLEASEDVFDYVRDAVNGYIDRTEVFIEQRLGDHLGVKNSYRELNDVDRAEEEYPGVITDGEELEEEAREFIEEVRNDEELKEELREVFDELGETAMMKCLKDPKYLGDAFVQARSEDLPLHLHSEYEEVFDYENFVQHSQRSIFQAEETIERSDADESYVVVGLGHVPHIRDYIVSEGGIENNDYWEEK